MKKLLALVALLSVCFFVSTKAFAPLATWSYSGGSGPQIVVSYNGSSFTVQPTSYDQPLRVDWSTPSGTQSVAVYNNSFSKYCNCNFKISGQSSINRTSSVSYYNYQP